MSISAAASSLLPTCLGGPEGEIWVIQPVTRHFPQGDGPIQSYKRKWAIHRPTQQVFLQHWPTETPAEMRLKMFNIAAATPFYTLGLMATRALLVVAYTGVAALHAIRNFGAEWTKHGMCLALVYTFHHFGTELVQEAGSRLLGIFTAPFYGVCFAVAALAGLFFGTADVVPLLSAIQYSWLQASYKNHFCYAEIRDDRLREKAKLEIPYKSSWDYLDKDTVLFLAFCCLSRGKTSDPKFTGETEELP